MTLKDLIWSKPIKYTVIGICAAAGVLVGTKILYDYSIYSNLKYVKKRLNKITFDEI